MIAEQMRIPDLWLKRELALALVPPGLSVVRITNQILAQCARGPQARAYTLNKMIAGDEAVRLADDLYYLAATFEFLVLKGAPRGFGRDTVEAYAREKGSKLALWPNAIVGTFGEFARSLLELVQQRPDYAKLGGERHFRLLLEKTVRQNLHEVLTETADPAGAIAVLSGKTRHWALHGSASERVVRQPAFEIPEVPKGDHIQLVVPAAPTDQIVLGFELRADERVILDPWHDIGSWFSPRFQPAGTAITLLAEFEDEAKNAYADMPGDYWVQIVGIDASSARAQPAALPKSVRKLVEGRPADWPDGYAEAMALVTDIERLFRKNKQTGNKIARDARNLEPMPGDTHPPVPQRARLYRTKYAVV